MNLAQNISRFLILPNSIVPLCWLNSTSRASNKVDGAKDSVTGFYMELGATAVRMATHLPPAVTATIQTLGQ